MAIANFAPDLMMLTNQWFSVTSVIDGSIYPVLKKNPGKGEEYLWVKCKFDKSKSMPLPDDRGQDSDWPKFKKETSEKAGFSNLENMNRLQKYLKRDAERSVRSLFLDPVNVKMIMKRLEELIGRPELIYQVLLSDVTRIRVDSNKIPELSEAIEAL
uniref:Uncharacterized protein n=1 Tax=Anopheles quadriannulatus TaxID=34691 RepID=A0A182WRW7_ANOQN